MKEHYNMTKEELSQFKELLLEKRAEILEDLRLVKNQSYEETTVSTDDSDGGSSFHMADVGTDTMEKEIKFYLASFGGNRLKDIEQALERIENGSYGICLACGAEINLERLEAIPQALKCVTCKTNEETY
jgi:RNA polymerase-binding protein DksA